MVSRIITTGNISINQAKRHKNPSWDLKERTLDLLAIVLFPWQHIEKQGKPRNGTVLFILSTALTIIIGIQVKESTSMRYQTSSRKLGRNSKPWEICAAVWLLGLKIGTAVCPLGLKIVQERNFVWLKTWRPLGIYELIKLLWLTASYILLEGNYLMLTNRFIRMIMLY